MIVPIKKMNDQVELEKHDSDTEYFNQLMLAGEQLYKLIISALVTGIDDTIATIDTNQYALNYELVRADSIGSWNVILDKICAGESYKYRKREYQSIFNEVTSTFKKDNLSWQYKAVELLNKCVEESKKEIKDFPARVTFRMWFNLFNELRNSKAHGKPSADAKTKMCGYLDDSLKLIEDNFSLFKFPWVYSKRNQSGTYRLTPLSESCNIPDIQQKLRSSSVYKDGVYILVGDPSRIDVIESTPEAHDFFLPNGAFKSTTFETFSYITGNTKTRNSSEYQDAPWIRDTTITKETITFTTQEQIVSKANEVIGNYDDWLVGALNFDEDLHFSSFYLDQSWKHKLPIEFKEYGYECMIACYQDFEETYFIPEIECQRVAGNLISKMKHNPSWFDNILDNIIKLADDLTEVFPFKSNSIPFSGATETELLDYYSRHKVAHNKLYVYSRIPEALDRGKNYFTDSLRAYLKKLHSDLSDTKKLNEVFEIFTFPEEISIAGKEFIEFMQILDKIKNDESMKELFSGTGSSTRKILLKTKPELLKEIENYREKWMFWNYHGYGNRVLRDVSYFLEKFKSSVNDSSVNEKAKNYQRIFKEAEIKKTELFNKYGVDETHRKLFKLYAKIGAVKLYRRYIQLQNFYFLDQLISRISHYFNIEEEVIRNLFPDEVEKLIKGELLITDKHKERVQHSTVLYFNDSKEIIAGDDAKQITQNLKSLSRETTFKNDTLIGEPCVIQKEIIKGHCKVVIRKEDLIGLIFNYGDILVCEAADPDLYDLMKKAAAVLTEQGGVTSHSSTYCRENNIKSITGIKGLLDNIYNNDLIEIDTSLGKIYKVASGIGELIIKPDSENIAKDQIGSKAFNLKILKNDGFNVPDFFCVPLDSLKKVLRKGTQDSIGSASQSLWDQIQKALNNLEGDLFAIRSSLSNEDTDNYSGAGMNRSEFLLTKEDIPKTLISLATDQIFSDEKNLSGSFIIQQMILGDISGIVFTKNPVSKNAQEILLEAIPGGNELLTDGLVRPIKFIVDKGALTIKEQSDENLWKDLIDDKIVKGIAETSLEIEKYYGSPQDIEWTISNSTLYVLQSRPITEFNSDISFPNFKRSSKSSNDIISIYRSYRIPDNLQRHMLEVAAVAKWIIVNHKNRSLLNEKDILTTLLLHDMGNIVKGLDESFANLFPEGYKYMPYWKAVQRWIIGRYGDVDTVATINMAKEIGVSDRVMFLIQNKQFLNNQFIYESDDLELKICAYSDQRVSPYGILPIRQRLNEAVNRYKGAKKKISVNDPKRDQLIEYAVKIEEQIFEGMKKKPTEVVNNAEQFIKELRNFNIPK